MQNAGEDCDSLKVSLLPRLTSTVSRTAEKEPTPVSLLMARKETILLVMVEKSRKLWEFCTSEERKYYARKLRDDIICETESNLSICSKIFFFQFIGCEQEMGHHIQSHEPLNPPSKS